MSEQQILSHDQLCAQIAEVLYVPAAELSDETELLEAGLDSIRVMTLLERWNTDGIEVSFVELAERPTLGQWWELLAERQGVPHRG